MNNITYNQKHNTMKKKFDINRVKEFCNLVNQGNTPNEALSLMNSSNGYVNPLKSAGLFWKEKDGTFRAVERVRTERYERFTKIKNDYNKTKNNYIPTCKQATLFNQPKAKTTTTTHAPIVKSKTKQLSFVQRVVKSLFKL